MPGYSQLKKLSETLLKLGNEINLRAQRGEKALPVPIPDTIPDIDDSQDFVLGMPEKPKPPEPEPEEAPAEEAAEEASSTSDVSVDDLLSGIASGGDSLDLSAFGDTGDGGKKSKSKSKAKAAAPEPKKEPEPPPKPKGISGSGYSGFGFDDDGNLEKSQAEDKMPDIGALMGGPGKKAAAPSGGMTGIPELDAILNPQKSAPAEPPKAEPKTPPAPAAAAPKASDEPADLDSFGDLGEIEVEDYAPPEEDASAPAGGDVDASALFGDDVEDFEMPQTDKDRKPKPVYKPLAAADDLAVLKPDIFTDNPVTKENPPYYVTSPYGTLPEQPAAKESAAESAAAPDDGFSLDDIPEMEPLSQDEGKPEGADEAVLEEPAMEQGAADDSLGGMEEPSAEQGAADGALDGMDDLGDFDGGPSIDLNMDLPQELGEVPPEVSSLGDAPAPQEGADSFEMPDMDGLGGMEGSGGEEISADAVEAPKSDEDIFSTDGMDFGGFDMTDAAGEGGAQEDGALPGESLGETDEATASALGDFDIQDTDSQLSKAGDDFALEGSGDDFSIPGFSEEGADPYANEGKKGGGLDQVDFSGAVTGDGKQRTQLTEDEYIRFKKNLHDYPLNVRIAVEEMIVKNEFTDEVVFEVIDKVLKKVTARQLAGHLEKMLDISLPVPRDYERRSAEEYEAYKASFAYQLKSRILPAIIVGVFAAMILFCLGYLGHRFIYKPLMAEKLYKEGYVLIEHDEFPQSEDKFNEALRYKSKKKWFFKYAQGYRAKKQYDRAELFYKNILKRFNHDKQAGLEYAQMEVDDLANYELAEEILKREVLDNHVNDPDGILALGDTYLEWGTENDSAKFANAYEEYSKLQQLYGSKNPNLYQSRFLRYNIRIDQLRNVLELKEFFFTQGEKSLDGKDWTELSGYLMDKQYGELPADQEFLRDKIEDVRDMMLYAIKALPENPTANYNLSRYLVKVGDHKKAMQALKNTKGLFDKAPMLNRREIYRQLDNYRLLGEEYLYDREYILAQDVFTEGLNLFESKNRTSDFEADKNVGVMYSDMGDLDYFISGDLDNARRNYQKSIDAKNDSPSIRYRVGYIDYTNGRYQDALGNFVKASQTLSDDPHLMLALGNTLSLKDDNYAAQGHYKRLLARLDLTREKYGIISPQTDERAGDMVETYMKASNNLGVSLFRVARQSGSSSKNAASLVNFQDSIRYYDAMTRNQETMIRLPGSNLAEMNLKYATHPFPNFEPEIYTEIPRVLNGEKGLKQ